MRLGRAAIISLFGFGVVAGLAYRYWVIPLFIIILAAGSGFFWVFLLAAVLTTLVVSRKRKWPRWKLAVGATATIIPAVLATGLWWLLFLEGPLFNLAAPVTDECRVYRATCQGWVFRSGETIGGAGTCFGSYKRFLGSSTYKVDVAHQKVWIWRDAIGFEPSGGWISLTERSADPSEKKTCEVLDYANWSCTDSDEYGTSITQLVGGREHSYEEGKRNPAGALVYGLAGMARCDVQVGAPTAAMLGIGQFSDWHVEARPSFGTTHEPATDWTDCTNPPP